MKNDTIHNRSFTHSFPWSMDNASSIPRRPQSVRARNRDSISSKGRNFSPPIYLTVDFFLEGKEGGA
jgi:hypothetical protein